MGNRRLVAGVMSAIALVGLGACSSTTKSSTTSSTVSSTTAATSAAQPTGAPIKVGLLCTCSGAGGFGAFIQPARDVYQAWVNSVNAAGGIAGHPVQLTVEDDAGNPGTAVANAHTLISDGVVAIADVSILDQAFESTLQSANIPVVGVESPNAPFGTNPDFYPEAQTNASATYATVATAKLAGATNIGDIYCAESPVCAASVPLFQSIGKQLGVPAVYSAEVSATAPNYTAQCVAANQQHVSSIFIGDSSLTIARIGSDCTQQGYQPIYVTQGAGFGLNEASAPGLKDRLWNEFPAAPFWAKTIPAVQTADAAIEKYYPGLQGNIQLYNETDFMAWISGALLADAIKAGGLTASATPTAAEVTQGLASLKNDTLQGLTVPLTFTSGQPHNVNCWITTRVQGGTPALVDNGKTSCTS